MHMLGTHIRKSQRRRTIFYSNVGIALDSSSSNLPRRMGSALNLGLSRLAQFLVHGADLSLIIDSLRPRGLCGHGAVTPPVSGQA